MSYLDLWIDYIFRDRSWINIAVVGSILLCVLYYANVVAIYSKKSAVNIGLAISQVVFFC